MSDNCSAFAHIKNKKKISIIVPPSARQDKMITGTYGVEYHPYIIAVL